MSPSVLEALSYFFMEMIQYRNFNFPIKNSLFLSKAYAIFAKGCRDDSRGT
jgi:hypothetical protein